MSQRALSRWNAHPSCWGSVSLSPNFTGTVSISAKISIPFDRLGSWSRYNFFRWKCSDNETSCFCRNLCGKRQIWVSEPHFGKVMGDARPWLMAALKANDPLSIRLNWTCSLSITVSELWGEICTAQLFSQGIDIFGFTFCLHSVVSINHSQHQKISDTGLPDDEDRIPLRSFVLTQCRSVTDGFAVAYTALAKL